MEETKIINPLDFKMKQGQDATPFVLFSQKGRVSINGLAAKLMGVRNGDRLLFAQNEAGKFFINTINTKGQALYEKKGGAMEFNNIGFCGLVISMVESKAPKDQVGKILTVKFQVLPTQEPDGWFRLADSPLKLLKREPTDK
jgi:hypothetical protein